MPNYLPKLVSDDDDWTPPADDPGKATVDIEPDEPPPPEPLTRWWHGAAPGLIFGILMFFAFPPVGLWPLALLAPVPLAWLTDRATARPGRWGLWAALGVLPFWLVEQVWVTQVSAAGYLPMCLYLSLFTWLLVWTGGRVRRRFPAIPLALALPVVWVGVDFLRGVIAFHGYPWFYIAHPLISAPYLAWPAALLGVYAVTFLVVAACGGALDLRSGDPRRKRAGMAALGVGIGVAVVGLAWSMIGGTGGATIARVAVVQTNVPQDNKVGWTEEQKLTDWGRFEELIAQSAAATPRPDLIVLPETMFPGPTLDPRSLARDREQNLFVNSVEPPQPTTYFADRLLRAQREAGVPVLIGAIGYDEFRWLQTRDASWIRVFKAVYNSALVVDDGQVLPERYDKLHLTPFGEEMPYFSVWPWLQRQMLALGANGMTFELSPGRGPAVLHVRGPNGATLRVATPICFEATKPGLCRSLVFQGGVRQADFLINLTNDGWFGGWDTGRKQHLQLARWRCLELGTAMVRAANTGISALIDPRGRVLRTGLDGSPNPSRVDGVLMVDVPAPTGTTIYARIGDVFGAGTALAAAGLFVWSLFPGRALRSPKPG